MKKLLSVFLVCSMLIVFASCGEDSADYSTAQMPIEDLCWGMSLNDAKKALDKQKIEYTEEEMEIENANAVKYLKLSDQPKMYGINIKERSVYFDKNNGLYRIAVAFDEADENKVMNAVSKEVGEFDEDFDKNEELENVIGVAVWTAGIDTTPEDLKDKKLKNELKKLYLEILPPSDSFLPSGEEQLEDILDKSLVYFEVSKSKEVEHVAMQIDATTAAILKNIDDLGAEGYYKMLVKNAK